jgi:hypothetical protein
MPYSLLEEPDRTKERVYVPALEPLPAKPILYVKLGVLPNTSMYVEKNGVAFTEFPVLSIGKKRQVRWMVTSTNGGPTIS